MAHMYVCFNASSEKLPPGASFPDIGHVGLGR